MHKSIFTLLLLCLFLPLTSSAQTQDPVPCATQDGKSDWLIQYQQNPSLFPNLGDTLHVPLTIHLVGDDSGFGYFNRKLLFEVICVLNADFAESEIQFYIKGDINYIPNSVYNTHTFGQGAQMMQEYLVPNTINCYIVDDPAGACGYSSYNLGVALAEQCIGVTDHTWAHELGHFFSLPHTFLGWEGFSHNYDEPAPVQIGDWIVERVDGAYCETASDGFCDTPPDYLNYRWFCDAEGLSTKVQVDPNGEMFVSDGSLFMSYASDDCMNRFSPGQIDAMRANLLTEKVDHLYQDDPLGPIDASTFNVISPEDGAFIDNYNTITFEWEPIENATDYIVEVSPFPNFTLVLYRYETTETKVVSDELPPNYELYWRVRPFSYWHTCLSWTSGNMFSTGAFTSVNELAGIEGLQVSPVPILSGESLQITFNLEKEQNIEINLLNVSGVPLKSLQQTFSTGSQTALIPTADLSPGVYVLQLKGQTGTISRKVVVTQ